MTTPNFNGADFSQFWRKLTWADLDIDFSAAAQPQLNMADVVRGMTGTAATASIREMVKAFQVPNASELQKLHFDEAAVSSQSLVKRLVEDGLIGKGATAKLFANIPDFSEEIQRMATPSKSLIEAVRMISPSISPALANIPATPYHDLLDSSGLASILSAHSASFLRLSELAVSGDPGIYEVGEEGQSSEATDILEEFAEDESVMDVLATVLQSALTISMVAAEAGAEGSCKFLSLEGNRILVSSTAAVLVTGLLPPPWGPAMAFAVVPIAHNLMSAYRRFVCGEEWQ